MKLVKLLFGRFAVVCFFILLQIALFLFFAFVLSGKYLAFFEIAMTITGIAVLLKIINDDRNQSGKITWVIVLTFFPLVGVCLYIMLNGGGWNGVRKSVLKSIKEQHDQEVKNWQTTDEARKLSGEYYGQSKYIEQCGNFSAWTGTKTEYISDGKEFFKRLKTDLNSAEKFIFMEYFIIDEGEIWDSILEILKEKAAKGVEVYLMYDDFGTINRLPTSYCKKLNSMKIKAVRFNKFLPVVTAFHNNRDHRKITVIDNKTAWTGGINLADEYANITHPYGFWKDSAIRIEGAATVSFTLMFALMYGTQVRSGALNYTKYTAERHFAETDGLVQPFCGGPFPFFSERVAENAYMNLINGAKKYLYITTPYLIIDYAFLNALKVASKRGVEVRIITPKIPDKKIIDLMTRSSYQNLIENGVKISLYTRGFIHAKTIVADGGAAIVGTINLDFRSFVHHFEDGVFLCGSTSVGEIERDFLATYAESEVLTASQAKLKPLKRLTASVLKVFAPLM